MNIYSSNASFATRLEIRIVGSLRTLTQKTGVAKEDVLQFDEEFLKGRGARYLKGKDRLATPC